MHVFASVTAGTVCPAAIYVVRTIYNPTNNAVFKQYLPKKPHPYLRRYTFLSHLTTKSKISTSPAKKQVAATCGVCMFIHKLSPSHS